MKTLKKYQTNCVAIMKCKRFNIKVLWFMKILSSCSFHIEAYTSSRKMSFYSRPMAADQSRRRRRSDEWFAFVRRARWEKKTFQTDDDSRTAGRWEAWILKGLINLWKPWNWTFVGFAHSISGKTFADRAKLQANPTENISFPRDPRRTAREET